MVLLFVILKSETRYNVCTIFVIGFGGGRKLGLSLGTLVRRVVNACRDQPRDDDIANCQEHGAC